MAKNGIPILVKNTLFPYGFLFVVWPNQGVQLKDRLKSLKLKKIKNVQVWMPMNWKLSNELNEV